MSRERKFPMEKKHKHGRHGDTDETAAVTISALLAAKKVNHHFCHMQCWGVMRYKSNMLQ